MPQDQRRVSLFRIGRTQMLRIPLEFELPGSAVLMHREGERLVIVPLRKRGLDTLLETNRLNGTKSSDIAGAHGGAPVRGSGPS
jgi:virulence-associated protein VagC